eukprot:jgi/Mesvir1/14248/Mv09684-RA.1
MMKCRHPFPRAGTPQVDRADAQGGVQVVREADIITHDEEKNSSSSYGCQRQTQAMRCPTMASMWQLFQPTGYGNLYPCTRLSSPSEKSSKIDGPRRRPHAGTEIPASCRVSASFVAPAAKRCTLRSSSRPQTARLQARFVYSTRQVNSRKVTCMGKASQEVIDKVRGIISEQLGTEVEKVTAESKFVDLGADSLDTVEIMMALEEQFGITLDEEGAEKIGTVQEAADLIAEQMK